MIYLGWIDSKIDRYRWIKIKWERQAKITALAINFCIKSTKEKTNIRKLCNKNTHKKRKENNKDNVLKIIKRFILFVSLGFFPFHCKFSA